ncbi:MAG: hypothetical protein NZM31_14830 [Gemmatales bacterium]|nr:hypothetical protein [Gemmatales bacterium]MDW8388270.1 hypothetical protein [Gemmatales bacterium]
MQTWVRRGSWAVALALLAVIGTASAQVRLAWSLNKGDKFYQETRTRLKQTTRVRGQETRQEAEYVTRSSFTVQERGMDGSVTLEQKIEAITPEGKTELSTSAARLLREMQGAVLTYTLSPDLRVLRIDGYDELMKRLAGDDASALKVVQTLLARETLQTAVEEAFAFLPREPMRPGHAWERRLTTSLGPIGSLTGRQQYTYEGPEDQDGKRLQAIRLELQLEYQPPRADAGILPFQVERGELRVIEGKGRLWFDSIAGRLVRSELNLKIAGALVVSVQGQQYTLELEQDQTVQIRIRDEPFPSP